MQQTTSFGCDSSGWSDPRHNWPITTPPTPGIHTADPSAPPPDGWQPLISTSLPGLECLTHLDRVFIDQRIDPLEVLTGFNRQNKYVIMSPDGQPLFEMEENSSPLGRLCCGNACGFEINVYDKTKREVLRLQRSMRICLGQLEVYTGTKLLGTIREKCNLRPCFDITNEHGNPVFQIRGLLCDCDCYSTRRFQVLQADGSHQIGVISKYWSGLAREVFTHADTFGISFPIDLDIQMKALLIGAAILIDFEYFEED